MLKVFPPSGHMIVKVTGPDGLTGNLAHKHPLIFGNHFNLQVLRFIIAVGVRYFQGYY